MSIKILDPGGRSVILSQSRWAHIVDRDYGHPEMAAIKTAVLQAVQRPDRRHRGHEPNEEWFYRGNVGPSRWIKVVVIYEDDRGAIVTAFPRREFP